jgi:hypothetical protein
MDKFGIEHKGESGKSPELPGITRDAAIESGISFEELDSHDTFPTAAVELPNSAPTGSRKFYSYDSYATGMGTNGPTQWQLEIRTTRPWESEV